MKSIIEETKKLIIEKEDFVSTEEIIEKLGETDMSEDNLKAIIYTDLLANGEFFLKEDKWSLKNNFTMNEVYKFASQIIIDDYLNTPEDIVDETTILENEDEDISLDEFLVEDDLLEDD